ncbi:MAG: DUF58 domain-containing protein [Anaerolineae bacterium]
MKLSSPLLPFLLVLLMVLQLLVPNQAWTILLVGLGGVWLICWLWARALVRSLDLQREMRFGWAQVGDQLEERFTLSNRSLFPALWVEVHDHSTLPAYDASAATGIGGQEENRWTVKSVCTRRGAFRIGPTTVQTGDPFGLYRVTLEYPASVTMMVMPPVVPLPDIQVASGGRIGEGREQINTFERTVTASAVRDYAPGDSTSSIHWRTSAHRDGLFVKMFDSTPTSDWWIVLDLDQQVQVGELDGSTMENGIILAASLADRGIRSRRAVGLVAFGQELVWLPPQQGEAQRWEILRALALVAPGSHPLGELLTQVQPSLGRRASFILVTPDVKGEWVQALLRLRWQGLVPTVLLLDPVSFTGGQSAHPPKLLDLLAEQGITRHAFTRDLFNQPEAHPGQEGRWDWRVSATGKARALHAPRETGWRPLSR